jgi:hypothetical protein
MFKKLLEVRNVVDLGRKLRAGWNIFKPWPKATTASNNC